MNSEGSNSPLIETDELLHKPTSELKWRESYYFNWVDIENEVSGFSTIGIVPNEKRREFVFLLFLKERNEVYYKEPPLHHYEEDINTMLSNKNLSYRLVEPFKTWEIIYNSRKLKFNIQFETRFTTCSFGKDSSASWQQHFEASGTVKGILKMNDGTIININGHGQRDKSWGFRDWHQFDKWYAGHFQFKDWSCGFRKDYIGDNFDLSGSISKKSGNIPISELDIKTINDNDQFHSPLKTEYFITGSDGETLKIKAERIRKNSFIRFVRNFQGGFTELFEQMVIMKNRDNGEIGSGMMEHLRSFRASNT